VDARITLRVFSDQEADSLLTSLMGINRAAAEPDQVAKVRGWCGFLPLALWICGQLLATNETWTAGTLARKLADEHRRLDRLATGEKNVWLAFAVSYGLLAEDDQLMFRLLGLHPGPQFDVLAAASLAGNDSFLAEEALEHLSQAHLIAEYPAERFGMHDLLRLFARDTCMEVDDPATRDAALARLIRHYAGVARTLKEAADGLVLLEAERSTLVSTLHLAVSQSSDEVAWQLGDSLRTMLRKLQYLDDLSCVLEDTLVIARRARGIDVVCSILEELGLVCRELRRTDVAIAHYVEALSIRRDIGDREGEALARSNLGIAYQERGDVDAAMDSFGQALALCEEGDPGKRAQVLYHFGIAQQSSGQLDAAMDSFGQALALCEEGDPGKRAQVLYHFGIAQQSSGQLDAAMDSFQQVLALCEQAGDPGSIEGKTYNNLGLVHAEQQRPEDALTAYKRALGLSRKAHDQHTEAQVLRNLGKVHSAQVDLLDAAKAYEQAREVSGNIGDRKGEGQILGDLGDIYRRLQQHEESVARYQGTLVILREEGDLAGVAGIFSRLAEVYREMGLSKASADAREQAQSIKNQPAG
jgi:tetratricopeptide (TPR) repeat protein